jgi:hypothetical protein
LPTPLNLTLNWAGGGGGAAACGWHWLRQVRGWGCEVGHSLALALGSGVWFSLLVLLVAMIIYCAAGSWDNKRRSPCRPKADWLLIGVFPLW